MKKKVITLVLSLVLASGSIGNVQILAADTTGQETESVQEEAQTPEVPPAAQEPKKRGRKKAAPAQDEELALEEALLQDDDLMAVESPSPAGEESKEASE